MEYVMVPVPEELVADVEQFVRVSRAHEQSVSIDEPTVARLLREFDPRARDILLANAAAVVAGKEFTVADAAVTCGCSRQEVLGLLVVLNNMMVEAGAPLAVLPILSGSSVDGRLIMAPNFALRFLDAAHEDTDARE